MAARGVILADSEPEELHGSSDLGRNLIRSSRSENSSSSSTGLSMSALSRLKENFHRLWLWAVQKWPSVCILFSEYPANFLGWHWAGFKVAMVDPSVNPS